MRLLFEIDLHNYADCTHNFLRSSAKNAMVHSLKFDYYEFSGGGIEQDEFPADSMIRETRDEAAPVIKPATVQRVCICIAFMEVTLTCPVLYLG